MPPHPLTDGHERLHAVRVAAETGHVDRQHAPRPPPHEVGSVAGQGLGDGGVAMASRNVQGSVVLLVLHVNTGTCMSHGGITPHDKNITMPYYQVIIMQVRAEHIYSTGFHTIFFGQGGERIF